MTRRKPCELVITLLIVLLVAPESPARDTGDWKNVKKLKSGTVVEIFLFSGENLHGEVDAVSDTGLDFTATDNRGHHAGALREVDRRAGRRKLQNPKFSDFYF